MKALMIGAAMTLAAGVASAASIDLGAEGFTLGARLFFANDMDVFVLGSSLSADNIFGANTAALAVDLGAGKASINVAGLASATDGALVVFDPVSLEALLTTGGSGAPVLARLWPGQSGALDYADGFLDSGATLEVFALTPTTVVPLPAAAPMLLAGIGALAVAARRRKA
jgi:hypothetical protein